MSTTFGSAGLLVDVELLSLLFEVFSLSGLVDISHVLDDVLFRFFFFGSDATGDGGTEDDDAEPFLLLLEVDVFLLLLLDSS